MVTAPATAPAIAIGGAGGTRPKNPRNLITKTGLGLNCPNPDRVIVNVTPAYTPSEERVWANCSSLSFRTRPRKRLPSTTGSKLKPSTIIRSRTL